VGKERRLRTERILKPYSPLVDDALELGGGLRRLQSDGGERSQAGDNFGQLSDLRRGSDDRFAREEEDLMVERRRMSVLGI